MPHFKYHAIFLIKFHIKVMQKFFLFFVKKLLTKFLSHSIISNVSGTRQNTKEYARVAQLVEHDLAKVGAAGSSPVSRSLFNKKGIRWMSFFVKSSPAGPGRSRSTLRSGRRRADVHWTSCAVSRSGRKRDTSHDVSLFFEFLRSGRCLTASTGRWLLRSAPVVA